MLSAKQQSPNLRTVDIHKLVAKLAAKHGAYLRDGGKPSPTTARKIVQGDRAIGRSIDDVVELITEDPRLEDRN